MRITIYIEYRISYFISRDKVTCGDPILAVTATDCWCLYFCLDQVKLIKSGRHLSGRHSRSDVTVMPRPGYVPGMSGSREAPPGIRQKHTAGSGNNVYLESFI